MGEEITPPLLTWKRQNKQSQVRTNTTKQLMLIIPSSTYGVLALQGRVGDIPANTTHRSIAVPMLPTVYEIGLSLVQHWIDMSCLLGSYSTHSVVKEQKAVTTYYSCRHLLCCIAARGGWVVFMCLLRSSPFRELFRLFNPSVVEIKRQYLFYIEVGSYFLLTL